MDASTNVYMKSFEIWRRYKSVGKNVLCTSSAPPPQCQGSPTLVMPGSRIEHGMTAWQVKVLTTTLVTNWLISRVITNYNVGRAVWICTIYGS